jgi:hypothetical protein
MSHRGLQGKAINETSLISLKQQGVLHNDHKYGGGKSDDYKKKSANKRNTNIMSKKW